MIVQVCVGSSCHIKGSPEIVELLQHYIKETDLEEEIRKKLFTYEDIVKLDDKSIQRVLRDIDNHVLALAIKASTKNIQDLLFKNLSKLASLFIRHHTIKCYRGCKRKEGRLAELKKQANSNSMKCPQI